MNNTCKICKIASLLIGILLISMFGNIFTSAISNTDSNTQDMGCTIFTVSYGDKVLFCGNQDWYDVKKYYWVVPPSEEGYGWICINYTDVDIKCGFNEKGLCMDGNGLLETPLDHNPELSHLPETNVRLAVIHKVMTKCSNVEESIGVFNSSYLGDSLNSQGHIADATGDAVVVSVGKDSKLAFTRKEKGDGYLVSTNFNLANPKNRDPLTAYPCWRYETAVEMLDEIEGEDDLTVAKCRSILDAVHLESGTILSTIFDPKNGLIYLYNFHNFDEVVVLNLEGEFAKREHEGLISDLFKEEGLKTTETPTPTTTPEVTEEKPLVQEKPVIGTNEIIVIGVIIMAVIAGLVGFSKRKSGK